MQLLVQTFMFSWKSRVFRRQEMEMYENSQVNGICWSKLPYPEFNQSQVVTKKKVIDSNSKQWDFLVSCNKKPRGRQLLVLVLQFQKIKAGISVIWGIFSSYHQMAAAVPVIITSFTATTTRPTRMKGWKHDRGWEGRKEALINTYSVCNICHFY